MSWPRCGVSCGCQEPCEALERRAELQADEYDGWSDDDLDRMADRAAAREYGGGAPC